MSDIVEEEKRIFVDKMYRERGYILDFHKVMAAEDFEFLKAYNQFLEASYTRQRILDARTKELIYIVVLTALKATTEHIKAHVKLALEHGATKQEILEALESCLPAMGVPAFMGGFEAWTQEVSPGRIEPSSP